MGRAPCENASGVKKGAWTPEEDILLVSYIQQNGAGNWKVVPRRAGLMRCSKSCRLRWNNYLRPGIRRGNFTEEEEELIIHLQALLGNRWSTIASYLPERTDNDIKNYWNTHLTRKLKKVGGRGGGDGDGPKNNARYYKGQWERRLQTDVNTARQALIDALSLDHNHLITLTADDSGTAGCFLNSHHHRQPPPSSSAPAAYAWSADNISRLLEGWTRGSPTRGVAGSTAAAAVEHDENSNSTQRSSPPTPVVSEASNCNYDVFRQEGKAAASEYEGHGGSFFDDWVFDESVIDMSLLEETQGMF